MPPEITVDDGGNVVDSVGFDGKTEGQRVQEAKAELITEQFGQPQPLILGKFTSQDALVQSYTQLESEAGRLRAELATLKAAATPPATPPATTPSTGEAPATTGETPPATPPEPPAATTPETPPAAPATPPAAPPEPSVPPERQQQIAAAMLAQAGGEQEFNRIAQWAATHLPQTEVQAFNDAVLKGDEPAIMRQLKSIQFDMMMANGYEPQLVSGQTVSTAAVKPFMSEAEVSRAMSDPRYSGGGADPAYIAEVEARLAASDVFGTR